jgi:hypothetical protein
VRLCAVRVQNLSLASFNYMSSVPRVIRMPWQCVFWEGGWCCVTCTVVYAATCSNCRQACRLSAICNNVAGVFHLLVL